MLLGEAETVHAFVGPRVQPQLQIHLQRGFLAAKNGRKSLILMVGAGRFERPTPCAQGSCRHSSETAYFQALRFQVDAACLLQLVER